VSLQGTVVPNVDSGADWKVVEAPSRTARTQIFPKEGRGVKGSSTEIVRNSSFGRAMPGDSDVIEAVLMALDIEGGILLRREGGEHTR